MLQVCALAPSLFVSNRTHMPISRGFDEFMNVTIKDAVEVYLNESKPPKKLGMCASRHVTYLHFLTQTPSDEILLKGDSITLVHPK